MKIIGIVPARMSSSRFPGKPLHKILDKPMIEHCFRRAEFYKKWDKLIVATCDSEIEDFCMSKNIEVIMTDKKHIRGLDRIAEAAETLDPNGLDEDIIVNVQGDEPLLGPDILDVVINPFFQDNSIKGTLLGVPIKEEKDFYNPNNLKLIHNLKGDVLYTSRSPIPYTKKFSPDMGAYKVGGVFGFRRNFLNWFTSTPESPLERAEICDSNRIYDHGFHQRLAPMKYRPFVSVDCPEDVQRVEELMPKDPLFGKY